MTHACALRVLPRCQFLQLKITAGLLVWFQPVCDDVSMYFDSHFQAQTLQIIL